VTRSISQAINEFIIDVKAAQYDSMEQNKDRNAKMLNGHGRRAVYGAFMYQVILN